MATRFTLPREQPLDANGATLPGAKANFYVSGTSTPQDTFSDNGLTTPNTNPVIADSAGRFPDIFLADADYKLVLTDANDVLIYTADPVRGPAGASEASQAEVDARAISDKYISPRRIADGVGLQGSSIASAAALTLPAVGDYFSVTGTTTVTSISTRPAGREVTLVFAASLKLTHNATTLILPGAADLYVVAGDVVTLRSEGGGNWRFAHYGPIAMGKLLVFRSGFSTTIAAGLTAFLGPAGHEGTEANVQTRVPFACTVRKMYVIASGTPGAGQNFAFTLRKNGADSPLVATISDANTEAADTTNQVQLAAGDRINVKLITSAGASTRAGYAATVEVY